MAWAPGRSAPYDPAVDPNIARQVLRLDAVAPLSPAMVEDAFARESWERHPSRYPDAQGRASAEAWAATLAEARAVLLREAGSAAGGAWPGSTDAAVPAPARRGLSRGAVVGIVAGSVALLAVLTAAGIGAAQLATTAFEQARIAAEEDAAPRADGDAGSTGAGDDAAAADEPADLERFEADENYFTFPAALEMYADGRYDGRCGLEHLEGCWEGALFVEADCATLEIELGFTNDEDAWAPADETRTLTETGVVAGEALPVVFGNDAYDFGWIQDVRCIAAAS